TCVLGECLQTCGLTTCDADETCVNDTCLANCGLNPPCDIDELCVDNTACQAICGLTTCAVGESCQLGACVRTCDVDTPCDDGLVCSADGTCEQGCDDSTDCAGGLVCLDILGITLQYCGPCTSNLQCTGTDRCIAGLCQQGSVCSLGFQWAYYKLARSPSDLTTLPGTIPFHDDDPTTDENWPLLQFQPRIALTAQAPTVTGLTQTLGIDETCPPEDAIVYGIDTGNSIDYSIIQHIGYFVPAQAGIYTFSANAPVPDQSLYVWFGDIARLTWINANADLIADGDWTVGTNTYLRVVAPADVGTYIPIRILFVNPQDCGEFELTVQDPLGNVIVSREEQTTDGEFVSNCPAANDILTLDFAPLIDIGLGLDGLVANLTGGLTGGLTNLTGGLTNLTGGLTNLTGGLTNLTGGLGGINLTGDANLGGGGGINVTAGADLGGLGNLTGDVNVGGGGINVTTGAGLGGLGTNLTGGLLGGLTNLTGGLLTNLTGGLTGGGSS
ncbi:hypothetical protein CI102_15160, partial [Trichoderma harzianum]